MKAISYFEERVNHTYSPMDLMAELKNNYANIQVVDVRNGPIEGRKDKISGAMVIPFSGLAENMDTLSKDRKIVVYCWDIWCNTAAKAAVLLLKNGFTDVMELRGGMAAWKEMKLPVESI